MEIHDPWLKPRAYREATVPHRSYVVQFRRPCILPVPFSKRRSTLISVFKARRQILIKYRIGVETAGLFRPTMNVM